MIHLVKLVVIASVNNIIKTFVLFFLLFGFVLSQQSPVTSLYLLRQCYLDSKFIHLGFNKSINIFDTVEKKKISAPAGYKSIYPIIKNRFKSSFGKKLIIYNDKERIPNLKDEIIAEVLIGGNYTTYSQEKTISQKSSKDEIDLGQQLSINVSIIYTYNGDVIYQQSLANLNKKAKIKNKKIKEDVKLTSLIEPLKTTLKNKLHEHLKSFLLPSYKANVIAQYKTRKNFFTIRRVNRKMYQLKPTPKTKGWGLMERVGDNPHTLWKVENKWYLPAIKFEVIRELTITDILIKVVDNPFDYTAEQIIGMLFQANNKNNEAHWNTLFNRQLSIKQSKEDVKDTKLTEP